MGRNRIVLLMALGLFASSLSFQNDASGVFASSSSRNLFTYSSSLFKQKVGYVDSKSGKKGMLLYGYEQGMEAKFNSVLSGSFSSEFLTILESGNPGVPSYSLSFENEDGASFQIGVRSSASSNEVYVQYGSAKAGIRYYTEDWSQEKQANGYTASFNSNNQYSVFDGNYLKLQFDPSTMVVSASDGTNTLKVWDFSSTYNDGMKLENDLGAFSTYRVKITFDEISPYSTSPLLLLSFGGYSFENEVVEAKTTLSANITQKAVLNQEYTLPLPTINNPLKGDMDSSLATVKVYDSNQNLISSSYTFIPTKVDTYFAYYEYSDDGKVVSCLEKIPCLASSEVTSSFSFEENYPLELNNDFGLYSSLYLPKAKVHSSALISSSSSSAIIKITKDGVVDPSCNGVSGGFTYVFSSYGQYEIRYYSALSDSICDVRYVHVTKNKPGIRKDPVSAQYELGSTLSLGEASIYIGDEEIPSTPKIIYPSCKEMTGPAILDEAGLYKISYPYSYNGKESSLEDSFLVKEEYSSYFHGDKSYATYGCMSQNNECSGVELTLFESSTLVYEKTIDLSDNTFDETLPNYEDNTKLLEIRSAPHSSGTKDAEGLYVVLTDESNPDNQITIRMKYLSYMSNFSRIRAKATGQSYVGYYYDFDTGNLGTVDNAQVHEDGGFVSNFNFTNALQNRDFSKTSLQLYFDNDTGRLYANPWQNYGTKEGYKDNRVSWLVRDFSTSDRLLSGGDTPWTGFSSGKVKLSLYATGISTSATFFITNIDGEDLSGQYKEDHTGPSLLLPSAFPDGEVNKTYPFPKASISDESNLSYSRVDVYKGNQLLSQGGDGFVPTTSGTYTLVYVASDSFGNVSTQSKDIKVLSSSSPIEISLPYSIQESAYLGERIPLPNPIVSGGVGSYDITISASSNNVEATIEDQCLLIDKTTPYTIRYIVKDYVGNSAKFIQRIKKIEAKDTPIFDFDSISLPASFFEGDGYDLSNYKAKLYSSDASFQYVDARIVVKDGNGERQINPDELYYPVSSDSVSEASVTFFFGTNSKTFLIPIVRLSFKIGFMSSYFAGEQVSSVEASDDGVVAKGNEDGLSFGFVRSVASKEFSLNWNAPLDDYSLVLSDSRDSSVSMGLSFTRKKGNLFLSCGSKEVRLYESESKDTGISYKEDSRSLYDSRGNFLFQIDSLDGGESFEGFPSGKFYFNFVSPTPDATLTVKNIDNQTINSSRRDSSGPYLFIEGNLSGRYVAHSSIQLPRITCFDVLSTAGEANITISVEGKTLKQGTLSEIGGSFTVTELGSYKVTYTFKDGNSNTSTYAFYFYVYDDVLPTLTFTSPLKDEVRVGDKLALPSISIEDQNQDTVRVDISIIDPFGSIQKLDSNSDYKFEEKGKYILTYLLTDENGNTNFYYFEINARG